MVFEASKKQASLFIPTPEASYGQRHKVFQSILRLGRERKALLLTKARYADGQSIATRLSRRITLTHESLRKALTKYNKMPTDTYEGSLYHLPRTLSWETVSNLEELTSVEVNCTIGNNAVPVETLLPAVRLMNILSRSEEEERIIHKEMINVASFYLNENSIIRHSIGELKSQSAYNRGCANLLHHRLLLNEMTLVTLSKCASLYNKFKLPEMKFCNLDLDNLYDAQNCSVPEPQCSDDGGDSDSETSE